MECDTCSDDIVVPAIHITKTDDITTVIQASSKFPSSRALLSRPASIDIIPTATEPSKIAFQCHVNASPSNIGRFFVYEADVEKDIGSFIFHLVL